MVKILYYSRATDILVCYENAEYSVARRKQKEFSNDLVRVEIDTEEKNYLPNNSMPV